MVRPRTAAPVAGLGLVLVTIIVGSAVARRAPRTRHGRRQPADVHQLLRLGISEDAEAAVVAEAGTKNPMELLKLAATELDALRFARAAAFFKHGARHVLGQEHNASGQDLEIMIRGGIGILECGEVSAAGYMLRTALWHDNSQSVGAEIWTEGAAALAQAHARDGTQSKNQVVDSILTASKATPPPRFDWFLWAVDTLKFQVKRDGEAASIMQFAVLRTPVGGLQLHRPSILSKIRWLLKRRRHEKQSVNSNQAENSIAQLESRLRQEPLPAGDVASQPATETSEVANGLLFVLGKLHADDTRPWRVKEMYSAARTCQLNQSSEDQGRMYDVEIDRGNSASIGGGSVQVQPVSLSPFIATVDNFASEEECKELIELGRRMLRPSTTAQSALDFRRTSRSAELLHARLEQPVVQKVLQRAAALLQLPGVRPSDFELQLVHYKEDQQYKLHYDAHLDPQLNLANDISRHTTMFLYLSDVDVGGETILPFAGGGLSAAGCTGCDTAERCLACAAAVEDRLLADCADPAIRENGGVSISPRVGKLVFWRNYHNENGTLHPGSIHAGCPVLVGEKYGANIWLDRRGGDTLLTQELSQSS